VAATTRAGTYTAGELGGGGDGTAGARGAGGCDGLWGGGGGGPGEGGMGLGGVGSGMGRGMPGVATREQVINVSERVGTLSAGTDASPDAANALSGVLNALSGAGNIQRKVTNYVLTIDREAFAAGVINGAYNFNTEVARAAAAAKP
jgi:hypothetical protein